MKISDDDLKRYYQSSIRDRVPPNKEMCPDAKLISDLFFESVADSEKDRLMGHIVECARCLEIFNLCLSLSRAENWLVKEIHSRTSHQRAVASKSPRHRLHRPVLKWVFVPLTTAFLAAIILLFTKTILTQKTIENRGRLPGVVDLISPRGKLPSDADIVFRWKAERPIEWVQIDLFNEDLMPLWKSTRIMDSGYPLPLEVQRQLEKGKVYFWMVTVHFPDGNQAESPLEEFSLRDVSLRSPGESDNRRSR